MHQIFKHFFDAYVTVIEFLFLQILQIILHPTINFNLILLKQYLEIDIRLKRFAFNPQNHNLVTVGFQILPYNVGSAKQVFVSKLFCFL